MSGSSSTTRILIDILLTNFLPLLLFSASPSFFFLLLRAH
jgi:hypothetical protein